MGAAFRTPRWGTEVALCRAWTSRQVPLICSVMNALGLTLNLSIFSEIKHFCLAKLANTQHSASDWFFLCEIDLKIKQSSESKATEQEVH